MKQLRPTHSAPLQTGKLQQLKQSKPLPEVAAYPGKTYLPESENVFFSHNPFWHHEGQFRFTPTLKTPSHIGMVYKGDSRPPETIFKTGFNRKSDDSDSINDNDFLEALLSTKLSPYKLTHGPDFLVATNW